MTDWRGMYERDPDRVYRFNGMAAMLGTGEKAPTDLVLRVFVPEAGGGGEWENLSMHFLAFAIDFLYANEDEIKPPRRGYAGGEYFTDFVYTAVRDGYRAATKKLEHEKRARRYKDAGAAPRGPAAPQGLR